MPGAAPPRCLGNKLKERWWRDREQILQEIAAHGTLAGAARAHGVQASTVQKGHRDMGLPPRRPGPQASVGLSGAEDLPQEWILDAVKKLGVRATVESIADSGGVPPRTVREGIEGLNERGYRVELEESRVTLTKVVPQSDHVYKASPELFDGETVRVGVVSDTHLNSKHCRLDELHTAYEVLRAEGIRRVWHIGDLTDGKGVYKHHLRDLERASFDDQVAFCVENYPAVEGITTEIISGNHDLEGDFGREAADPVRAVCAHREDMIYMGEYSAWIEFEQGTRFHLLHPGGGGSYAISYRPQKIIEGYEGGVKPNATLFGHWHRRGNFEHRNVQALLCGTFSGSSALAIRYGLGPPAVGFHILEFVIADDGSIVEWTPRWLPFYAGRVVKKV